MAILPIVAVFLVFAWIAGGISNAFDLPAAAGACITIILIAVLFVVAMLFEK
jgi:hypothetical protein